MLLVFMGLSALWQHAEMDRESFYPHLSGFPKGHTVLHVLDYPSWFPSASPYSIICEFQHLIPCALPSPSAHSDIPVLHLVSISSLPLPDRMLRQQSLIPRPLYSQLIRSQVRVTCWNQPTRSP
ncbi:uncharacterized protein LAESUDRAFT_246528 [Laetiporus sulphureus 93-53]|uniref:Uncharacterized protein n=1 Tax=Laetiporus sulphureus 93-53 TaxID=1314785 RepID=A0A165DHS8_9APHY|nr:uncharacterized protein LAESUDRAFT_246528 [Laetiporus sulphureus 93-53]KZT04909.1 hypothetical protein LAESUDRAFT_246528 [Laetiporus sulphureus 93-53]